MVPQEFKNIEKILESFLGPSKNGMSDTGQLAFPCPKCIDEKGPNEASKFNLEVNLYKMVFKCWSCCTMDDSMMGSLSKLIKKYGTLSLYRSYKEEVDSLVKSKMYRFDTLGMTDSIPSEVYVTLPKTFSKIDLEYCKNDKVVEYLSKRRITQDIIDRFNIGYTTWYEETYALRNRIIIPSYDAFGDLNYWVGRDFTGKSKSKYRNCDADKKNIVFQESLINFDADIILCEGAIDCLYPCNAISMLGKSLSKDSELYRKLVAKASGNIIICLDSDTDISETKRIYNLLNFGRLRDRIMYIRLNRMKDIGEIYEAYGKKGIIKAVQSARKFTELELVFE